VEDGPIGSFTSQAGNIGSASDPVVIRANGGVEIDPETLDYVVVDADGDGIPDFRAGVGSVIAEIGSIWVDITTGGSVGVADPDNPGDVDGGIAAPLGSVSATLNVGQHVGGISGQSTSFTGNVLGVIGIVRSAADSTGTVNVNAQNPLVITGPDTNASVTVGSGTAVVSFTVSGGVVTFDTIVYTPAPGGPSSITITGGDVGTLRMVNPNPTATDPIDHTINAPGVNFDSIRIEGDLDSLTAGDVDTVIVTGDVNAGATISIGSFDSFIVQGTDNVGLFVGTIVDRNTAFGGVSVDAGEVEVVTFNGGDIREVRILSSSVRNLTIAGNVREITFDVSARNAGNNINGLTVAGDVGSIELSHSARISNVSISGDLGRAFAGRGINKISVSGDAGVIDGGRTLQNVVISGDVDVLKATHNMQNVSVAGNAGSVSSGNRMTRVFVGGSSIHVGARFMRDVNVVGSVGASLNTAGVVGLGSAFSSTDIARILGTSVAGLFDIGDEGPDHVFTFGHVFDGAESGNSLVITADHVFLGGLEAAHVHNVAVGGAISDLVVTGSARRADGLIVSTVDDATVRVGRLTILKVNGEFVGDQV
jgi:hypothetical protein